MRRWLAAAGIPVQFKDPHWRQNNVLDRWFPGTQSVLTERLLLRLPLSSSIASFFVCSCQRRFYGDKHSHQIIKHDRRHPLTICSLSNVCLSLGLVTELKETLTQEAVDVFQSVNKWISLSPPTISFLLYVFSSWTTTLFRPFHGWKHVSCLLWAALFTHVSMRLMLLAPDTQCCGSPDSRTNV